MPEIKINKRLTTEDYQRESSKLVESNENIPDRVSTAGQSCIHEGNILFYPNSPEQKKELASKFKVGDIVVTEVKNRKKVEWLDPLIALVQVVARSLGISKRNCNSRIVHVAIVSQVDYEKGRVFISEAMPSKKSGLRTVDLFEHKSCRLEKDMGYGYDVYRPDDSHKDIAEEAAEIARRFAGMPEYLAGTYGDVVIEQKRGAHNKFSMVAGLKSMFKRYDKFTGRAQRRMFKGLFEEAIQADNSIGGRNARKFFCSAFAAHAFQKAEAKRIFNEISKISSIQQELDEIIKATKGLDRPNAKKQISKWAERMANAYGPVFKKKMTDFNIDFKYTSPQDFVAHLKEKQIADYSFSILSEVTDRRITV